MTKFKTKLVGLIITLALFLAVFGPLLLKPKPVQALIPDVIGGISQIISTVWDKVKDIAIKAYDTSVATLYRTAINKIMGDIARQAATRIATGDKGAGPLFKTDPYYWKKLGDHALGSWIDSAAKDVLGQSLCDPIDPTIKFKMLISLDPKAVEMRQAARPDEMKCSLTKIGERLKEASKKNLFEFEAEVREGKPAQYKSSILPQLMAAGTETLSDSSRTTLLEMATELNEIGEIYQELIKQINLRLEEIRGMGEFGKVEIKALSDRLSARQGLPGPITYDYFSWWTTYPSECLKLSKEDFCSKIQCASQLGGYYPGNDCQSNYNLALKRAQNGDLYGKQIWEWAAALNSMIEKTKKDIEEGNFNPPELATLEDASKMFNPEGNDIGVSLQLKSRSLAAITEEKSVKESFGKIEGDVNSMVGSISGIVKTPSSLIRQGAGDVSGKKTEGIIQYTKDAVADAVGVFMSTLIQASIKNVFEKGFNPKEWVALKETEPYGLGTEISDAYKAPLVGKSPLTEAVPTEEGLTAPTIEEPTIEEPAQLTGEGTTQEQIEAEFASLSEVPLLSLGEVNILQELSTCPANTQYALPFNCTIDTSFGKAIEEKLTISEAIEKGLLHGDWLVSGGVNVIDQPIDYKSRYSLANIIKLRRARIVPLGLEIAARKIKEGTAPDKTNLKTIVDGFKDSTSPFYKLVDPNWVLKAVSFDCPFQAIGAIPQANSAIRQETCVDLRDCVIEGKGGKCEKFGYCTREKNVLRLGGEECLSAYDTCKAYKRTSDKKQFSYIDSSLDSASCNQNNVGCKWYCDKKPDGKFWKCDNQALFFNRLVSSCDSKNEGCSEFIKTKEGLTIPTSEGQNYPEDIEKIYLKKAPDYLNCYDEDTANDSPECFNFAKKCQADEVGCDKYSAKDGRSITAVVGQDDTCSASCVNYADFKEMSSYFDQGRDFVPFIPETAKTCSAENVGCDEFTNLDVVAKGGEGKEYYSYLRQCAKLPDEAVSCSYYYTWVGEETGYQLKEYYLKKGTDNGPAQVNAWEDLGNCDGPENLVNPNCKQFYDASGNVYYRYYKRTVTCSEDCHPYRKTIPAVWPDRTTQTEFMALAKEGVACSKEANSCRAYKGTTANVVKRIFFDDFETTKEPWNLNSELSPFSLILGEHSLKVIKNTSRSLAGLPVSLGNSYLLSFWAWGTDFTGAKMKTGGKEISFIKGPIGTIKNLNPGWQEVVLGPIYINFKPETLEIISSSDFYLDKVELKEVRDSLYSIKNSWQTPIECDSPYQGAMIGCAEYKNSKGQTKYLKSFSRLCSEDKIGCEALIETKNSTSPFEEKFNQPAGDTNTFDNITISADSLTYLVNDPKKSCLTMDKGCQKLGLPKQFGPVGTDGRPTVTLYQDVYLKNNPDQYSRNLCQEQEENCEEFLVSGSATPIYFKEPKETCQYNEKIMIGDNLIDGWFITGTQRPCYPDYRLIFSNQTGYQERAGLCPIDQTGCAEFVYKSLEGAQGDYYTGKSVSYYYIDDKRLDKTSCQSRVSEKEGCFLFNNTQGPAPFWSSEESYKESRLNNNKLVQPKVAISPEVNDANLILKVKRDRVCAEWLVCAGQNEWSASLGQEIERCDFIKSYQLTSDNKEETKSYLVGVPINPLSETEYKGRNVSWSDLDYSGHSIYQTYPLDRLAVYNVGNVNYLTKTQDPILNAGIAAPTSIGEGVGGQTCTSDSGCSFGQKCVGSSKCVIPPTSRAYPEENSPFTQEGKIKYPKVNVCELTTGNQCQQPVGTSSPIAYKKADYQAITRYYPGDYTGTIPLRTCNKEYDSDCGADCTAPTAPSPLDPTSSIYAAYQEAKAEYESKCPNKLSKVTTYNGWQGWCLEPDPSRPESVNSQINSCLTWWPRW